MGENTRYIRSLSVLKRQMSGSSFLSPRQNPNDDALELDGELERMIENVELWSGIGFVLLSIWGCLSDR